MRMAITWFTSLLLAASMIGCASDQSVEYRLDEDQNFHQPVGAKVIIIRWTTQSFDALQVTGGASKYAKEGSVFLGCAGLNPSGVCQIYTADNTTHQILGHELRHCFQGAFHD